MKKGFIVRCITHYKLYPDYFFETEYYIEANNSKQAQKLVKKELPTNEVLDYINKIKEIRL